MSSQLLYSMYSILEGNIPMNKQYIHDFNKRHTPEWMNLSKPLISKSNIWHQATSFHQLQIKSTLSASTCTELISVSDFDEDTSCCSLFLIFGGRSSEIRDGSCRIDDEKQLYLLEMVDNEFSTCLSYVYDEELLNEKQIPQARYGHSSVFDRERKLMYVFGGRAGGKCHNDLAIFDVVTSLWTIVDFANVGCLVIPQERYGHNCAIHNNWMIVFGGMDSSGNYMSGIQAMDLNHCSWINIQVETLSGRSFFTMDVIERKDNEIEMIIAGGIRKDPNEKPLQRLSVTFEQERTLNCSAAPIENQDTNWDKYGHSSVLKNQTLLLVGGQNQDHSLDCNSLEYSIESGNFSSFSYFLQPSTHCSLSFLNISQETGLNDNENDGFYFASLLYDSTLNCYVVGGNSITPSSKQIDISEYIINDTWVKIVGFLNYDDLKSSCLVSKRFYSIFSADVIWKPILFKYFEGSSQITKITNDYKKQFQKLIQIAINDNVNIACPIKRRSVYEREIDFIPPNITRPTKSFKISIVGEWSMVTAFISKLTGIDAKKIKDDGQIYMVQFYFHHHVYHLLLDTRLDIPPEEQGSFSLKLICISLAKSNETARNLNNDIHPIVVLGLQEELYKVSTFKKNYFGQYVQKIQEYKNGNNLKLLIKGFGSVAAFEKISIVTGFGMHQLLEFFLDIIESFGQSSSKEGCTLH